MNVGINQLDIDSIIATTKYFESPQDFINIICVCKKFKETTEKLTFNPIPVTSIKLFPNLRTQHFYSDKDKKIDGIIKSEIWYKVDYDQYLKYKEDNIIFHYIVYTRENKIEHGDKIPDNATILGVKCFCRMFDPRINMKTYLKEITIPPSVKSFGNDCFSDCSSLSSINLPTTIQSLSKNCFRNCCSLTSINLPFLLASLGDNCFSGCSLLTSINLPFLLTSIGDNCFSNCKLLKPINLPDSLKSLGNGCFNGCKSLKSINLPDSLTSLGDKCFSGCSLLTSINLPYSLTSLGSDCFDKCTSLLSIKLPSTIKSLGNNCFNGCASLGSINLPDSLTSLGKGCFNGCKSLKPIHFPPSLKFVGAGCLKFKKVNENVVSFEGFKQTKNSKTPLIYFFNDYSFSRHNKTYFQQFFEFLLMFCFNTTLL